MGCFGLSCFCFILVQIGLVRSICRLGSFSLGFSIVHNESGQTPVLFPNHQTISMLSTTNPKDSLVSPRDTYRRPVWGLEFLGQRLGILQWDDKSLLRKRILLLSRLPERSNEVSKDAIARLVMSEISVLGNYEGADIEPYREDEDRHARRSVRRRGGVT